MISSYYTNILREIEFDLYGPLVYKKRYTPWKNRKATIGKTQRSDGNLIQFAASKIGFKSYIYDSEWPDYIEDYNGPKTKTGTIRLQQVFFDHVLFTDSHVIIFESDDKSHYDQNYCIQNNFNYEDIIKRDKIKDVWARRNDIKLVRLKEYKKDDSGQFVPVSREEKKRIIFKVLRDVKTIENSI